MDYCIAAKEDNEDDGSRQRGMIVEELEARVVVVGHCVERESLALSFQSLLGERYQWTLSDRAGSEDS